MPIPSPELTEKKTVIRPIFDQITHVYVRGFRVINTWKRGSKEYSLMKARLSMTSLMRDEDIEALIAHCSTCQEFTSGVKALAMTGYLIPLVVLRYCFDGN
jgi:hypothetical protein